MNNFDDLVERLTHRLRIDRELQLEIAHELRSHLEDSAAEFGAAGMNPDEARAAAAKAMGDENELAGQLWEANRRRIRLRKVVRWTAGATLMPAAIALTVTIAWGAIVSVAVLMATLTSLNGSGRGNAIGGDLTRGIANRARQNLVASLSSDSRFIFEATQGDSKARVAQAKALAERYPAEPIYWANYATQAASAVGGPDVDPVKVQQALAVLDRGKQVEPANGFYPLVKAAVLFDQASKYVEKEPDPSTPGFTYTDSRGKQHRWTAEPYQITDPERFAQAVAELHEAAGKPYVDSYAMAFLEQRLGLLPAPTRLSDQLLRIEYQIAVLLPYLNGYRFTVNAAGAYAIDAASQGRGDEARRIVADARRLSLVVAQRSRILIEVLVASSMYSATLAQETMIDKQLGQTEQFDRALAKMMEHHQFMDSLRSEPTDQASYWQRLKQAGMIQRMLLPTGMDFAKVDFVPERQAEYAVLDRMALSLLLTGLAAAVALPALRAVYIRWRTGQWPLLAFVGWQRVAKIVLLAVLAPIGAYAVYAYLTPLGGRMYGVWPSIERIAVEYAALASVIIILLRLLSDAALRKRGEEIDVPDLRISRPGWVRIGVGLLLATAVVGYLIVWHVLIATSFFGRLPTEGGGFLLGIAVACYGLSWVRPRMEPSGKSPRLPVWVGWAVAVALLGQVAWFVSGPISYSVARRTEAFIASFCVLTGVSIIAVLAVQMIRALGARDIPTGQPVVSYHWCAAPIVLLAGLTLAIVAGIPLRFQERRAVAAMDSPSAYSLGHELQFSRWAALQQRMDEELKRNDE